MAITRRNFFKVSAGSGLLLAAGASPAAAVPKSLPPEAVGMLYDATLCIGCKSCMVNCKKYNAMPGGVLEQKGGDIPFEYNTPERIYDAPRDLSSKTVNIIKMYTSGTAANKDAEENGFSFVKQQCLHCIDPACASVCPVAALHKDPESGVVAYEGGRCIGCRYCQVACPFGVPKFEWESASPRIIKCELCHHRFSEGKYAACCEFCPTGAAIFGKVVALREEARRRLALKPGNEYAYPVQTVDSKYKLAKPAAHYVDHIYGLTEAGGTQCLLMAGVPFAKLGFSPRITDEAYPDFTWAYIKKLPVLITLLIVAGAASHIITRRDQANKS